MQRQLRLQTAAKRMAWGSRVEAEIGVAGDGGDEDGGGEEDAYGEFFGEAVVGGARRG